jgi:hypothetical protein
MPRAKIDPRVASPEHVNQRIFVNTAANVKHINEALATYGAGPFITTDTTGDDEKSVVTGNLDGRSVRVEFTVGSGSPDPAHAVAMFDAETGDQLGQGDSAATFADAISSYHWNGALTGTDESR